MSLKTRGQEATVETEPSAGLTLRIPGETRILIVSDDNSDTERLKDILRGAGFISEWAKSITAGWEGAKSGRFQGVRSTPQQGGGSWGGVVDTANYYALGFEGVLWARKLDFF